MAKRPIEDQDETYSKRRKFEEPILKKAPLYYYHADRFIPKILDLEQAQHNIRTSGKVLNFGIPRNESVKILQTQPQIDQRKKERQVSREYCRVLDAPKVRDCPHSNLLDWDQYNTISVGLSGMICTWKTDTEVATIFGVFDNKYVTCIKAVEDNIAVGNNLSELSIFDREKAIYTKVSSFFFLDKQKTRAGTLKRSPP